MATIELYKDKINSMSNYIEQAKSAVSDFCVDLSALKTKILGINSSVCDGIISKISTSSQTQEQQIAGLEATQREVNDFIDLTINRDNAAADAVSKAKKEFYKEYDYLKPDSEKSDWEKFCDKLKDVGEWCKEHWKEIVKITAIILLVAASILILVFVPGGGLFSAILIGAAKGCLMGIASNLAINGVVNKINNKSFFEGSLDAALSGAIGGFIGGGITGGLVGNAASLTKASSQGLMKIGSASTLSKAVAQGAAVGAVSSSSSNAITTGVMYWINNGTLQGASSYILTSAASGALCGGLMGGIGGGFQYRTQNPQAINPEAAKYELKALMQQGISEPDAIDLIEQFNKGINPGNQFGFHFTTLKGGAGITSSRQINMSTSGFAGKGVYTGNVPVPTWELKHIPIIGWGIADTPVRIPILLNGYDTKKALYPLFTTVIKETVHLIAD